MKDWYQQLKNIYHFIQAHWWRLYYGRPDRGMKIYGVTGTNGKTTTAIVLGSILRAAKGRDKVGLITTELFWFGEEEKENKTHMTSVDARVVYSYLRRMADAGVTNVVMEMTSHALDQHRLAGLKLAGAILLNIRHEHLDYHGTMEEYAKAKVRIIDYLRPGGCLVFKEGERWLEEALANHQPTPRLRPAGKFQSPNIIKYTSAQAQSVTTPLAGDFNKENVLAASLLAGEIGVSEVDVRQGVAEVKQIPGRMEWVEGRGRNPRVLIDFALTPYAYERLFQYLRGETKGKLIAVFGAAGRRDKEKRPIISKIVSGFVDEIVLTQDEPYDDPEEEIYAQLEAGLKEATIPWRRIEDRREALEYAINKSGADDVVAVPGMGNYDVRMVGNKKIPWNDKQVILEIFNDEVSN